MTMRQTMKQISANADKELNKLSRDIGKAEAQIKEGTELKDTSWDKVFEWMSEFDSDPKFIADDGHTLTRQSRQGSPKLDEEKLYQLLVANLPPAKMKNLWNQITERKINSLKLEQAVQAGKIPAKFLETAITMPPLIYARVRRAWSKEDAEKARMYGVEARK